MTYKEAEAEAKAYDAGLLATDPRFYRCVRVLHQDGSVFHWDSAFIMKTGDDQYICVFTEYHGFHVFFIDELREYRQYVKFHGIEILPSL